MTHQVDLTKYQQFVQHITSDYSNHTTVLLTRIQELSDSGVNVSLLMTGAMGMCAEAGEFAELPKKILFQGKPVDADTVFHMKRELGDIMWYWVNACRALDLDPNDVIAENVSKLESRYPGGEFDVHHSENRAPGDL